LAAADCRLLGDAAQPVSQSAFWVGLDGYVSKTVEQTGTEADCAGATPVYYAWYEFYPARPVVLDSTDYPVVPGDSLHAEVSQTTLTLVDSTEGWTATASVPAKGDAFNSAEWIAEGPTNTLTDFHNVAFSAANASGNGVIGAPIDSLAWSNDAVTMTTHGNGPHASARATPSPLSSGTAFTIAWQHP
jgi:hypothetical protein